MYYIISICEVCVDRTNRRLLIQPHHKRRSVEQATKMNDPSSATPSPQNVANETVPTMNNSKAIMNAGFGKIQIIIILRAENGIRSKDIVKTAVAIQCCCAELSNLVAKTKFYITDEKLFGTDKHTHTHTHTNKQQQQQQTSKQNTHHIQGIENQPNKNEPVESMMPLYLRMAQTDSKQH